MKTHNYTLKPAQFFLLATSMKALNRESVFFSWPDAPKDLECGDLVFLQAKGEAMELPVIVSKVFDGQMAIRSMTIPELIRMCADTSKTNHAFAKAIKSEMQSLRDRVDQLATPTEKQNTPNQLVINYVDAAELHAIRKALCAGRKYLSYTGNDFANSVIACIDAEIYRLTATEAHA